MTTDTDTDTTDLDELYPEHAKQRPHLPAADAIGGFLESSGLVVAEWERKTECCNASHESRGSQPRWRCRDGVIVRSDWAKQIDRVEGRTYKGQDDGDPCDVCEGTGLVDRDEPILVPTSKTTVQILADYFDIDLDKIEDERRQMLENLGN